MDGVRTKKRLNWEGEDSQTSRLNREWRKEKERQTQGDRWGERESEREREEDVGFLKSELWESESENGTNITGKMSEK